MHKIIQVSDDFWNIRGSYRIGGLVDVGTQASLVRRSNGKFVFLDTYTLGPSVARKVHALTNDGKNVEAILNLHPFHTLHVESMHARYPKARLIGTARHHARFPQLPWETLRTEDKELHAKFSKDFDFSIPRGVDFISANENVHFSSVLALHRASQTIHVDDTFMYIRLPALLRWFGLTGSTSFHPTLSRALERRAGAARDFRKWAEQLIERWCDAENLCTAHTGSLTVDTNRGASIQVRLSKALDAVEPKLIEHEKKYG